jgi:hypothetical protein
VCLSDLAFFAACSSLGNGGGLGAASGFDTFCSGSTGRLFGLAQSTAHGGVGVFHLMSAGGLRCVTRCGLCSGGGGFGFGLGEQRLLTYLLGSTVPQLRAILPARSREVAILRSVKVGPGVENRYIFGGLRYCRLISPVRVARIHISQSCASGYGVGFT